MRDRRPFINLLIGVVGGLVGFAVVAWVRQRRCGELGGTWDDRTRACMLPAGSTADAARTMDILVGFVIAAFVAFMMFRMFQFAAGQARFRRRDPS